MTSTDELTIPPFLLRKEHPEYNQRTPRPKPIAETATVEAGRVRVFLTGLRGIADGFHSVRVLSLGPKWARIDAGGKSARLRRSKWDEIEAAAPSAVQSKETVAMETETLTRADEEEADRILMGKAPRLPRLPRARKAKSADDKEADRVAVEAGKIIRARKAKQAKKDKPALAPKGKTALMIKVLSRKNGATRAEVLDALKWPAINLKGVGPTIAKRFGYRYSQKKVEGVTRYYLVKA